MGLIISGIFLTNHVTKKNSEMQYDDRTMSSDKHDPSWIVQTGQKWKILVIFVLGAMTLILFVMMVYQINYPSSPVLNKIMMDQLEIEAIFFSIALLFVFSFFVLIRCPSCNKKTIWIVVSKNGLNDWVNVVLALKSCPVCGYQPEQKIWVESK